MNRRKKTGAIQLNILLWRIFMLLALMLAALLYVRFRSAGGDAGTVVEAVQAGNEEAAAAELFGKSLASGSFREFSQDEDVIYTVMSTYYNEKSGAEMSYSNLHTWSQAGLTEGSYFVYAAYEVSLAGIATTVPSLSWVYLQTGEDGSLYISDVSDDTSVQALAESLRSSEEGQTLIAFAQDAYEEAVESDAALAQYMENYRTAAADEV